MPKKVPPLLVSGGGIWGGRCSWLQPSERGQVIVEDRRGYWRKGRGGLGTSFRLPFPPRSRKESWLAHRRTTKGSCLLFSQPPAQTTRKTTHWRRWKSVLTKLSITGSCSGGPGRVHTHPLAHFRGTFAKCGRRAWVPRHSLSRSTESPVG